MIHARQKEEEKHKKREEVNVYSSLLGGGGVRCRMHICGVRGMTFDAVGSG